ncbi:Uncharacterised protein [Bordetella pertussis]|nr:Uncharacterised protein [Bordetella pertussis]CPL72078.1 Uncharacterised protein [Bordetella pertussis]CPM49718.1 Uncharacterised protein [Bordetella pertussis]
MISSTTVLGSGVSSSPLSRPKRRMTSKGAPCEVALAFRLRSNSQSISG